MKRFGPRGIRRRSVTVRPALAASALVSSVMLLSGCAAPTEPVPTTPPPTPSPVATTPVADATTWRPSGHPVDIVTQLEVPWSVVVMPDGTQLVSQRDTGDVLEVDPGAAPRVVGRVDLTAPVGEGGLLGIAVPDTAEPDGDEEASLYAYVTTADDNRVVRMPLEGERGDRRLGDPEVVIDGIPRDRVHNGGRIAFGPDGLLYVATGDAGNPDAAQDLDSLGGKILRLTPDGEPAPGNPFESPVYSLGHRNVQGMAWTQDGTLWASEFGQDTFDELNRIEAGGNYGWPVHEGTSDEAGYVSPVVTWTPDEASPSGIAARGNTVFVAGLRGERVWQVDVADSGAVGAPVALWQGELGRVRDAVVAGDELWLLTGNTDGRGNAAAGDDRLVRVALTPGG
ncbi:PQQ-dependent sugar dehydrogenase [Microbacterium imperiale]|uniref:Oxidoreductase n=1 Tax=Microbacterium imperiale TaxID=33884 RepID=A0A9W6HJE0_9MICO|nr:PQQ-dependent sugar dehydrogenase [Microbacterium imperiale]MBP2421865.1 glucose/arabinose dehydrogenase [Microbacterium imperiale]MDS0199034.1 PQQ-dependent sugar dehydrogenase [Microbacterium imperiale]BFE39171.1 PQQ-dependent sugar dehydrogenase [Microbacterium imperiale]GLJ81160.1 oxidoreductase [Microbacterium imperiale]